MTRQCAVITERAKAIKASILIAKKVTLEVGKYHSQAKVY